MMRTNKYKVILILVGIPLTVVLYVFLMDPQINVKPDQHVIIEEVKLSTDSDTQTLKSINDVDIILFFELKDFSCPTCIKNFLHYSDYVSNHFDKWGNRVLFITSRNQMPFSEQKQRLKAWAKANYINPDIEILISKNFKNNNDIKKSSILIANNEEFEVFNLPLIPSKQHYIDQKMNI